MRALRLPSRFALWLGIAICLGAACALPAYEVTGASSGATGASSGAASASSGTTNASSGTAGASSGTCGGTGCDGGCALDTDCASGDFCWVHACVRLEAIAARDFNTCALTTAGGVQCWGENEYGQLGDGSTTGSSSPVAVVGFAAGAGAVTVGDAHACALTTGGGVQCWGDNSHGDLGNGSTTPSPVPIPVTGLLSGVAAISAGGQHTCALTKGGGVQCWGDNSDGQLGDSSNEDSHVPVAVTGLSSGVTAISAGDAHTCALTTGGGVTCWGLNSTGQLGDNSMVNSSMPVPVMALPTGVAAISLGDTHTCARTGAGEALCWGDNTYGQLGDGTLMPSPIPSLVSKLSSGVAAVAAGTDHTCALMTGGGVLCWGDNMNGDLGDGSTTQSLVPVAVSNLSSGVASISAGGVHTCALATAGSVRCWGGDTFGQLGIGTTSNLGSPVPVSVVEP